MELKEYKLGDIAEISTGYPFDGNLYAKEGIRVLRGENIGDGILKWDDRIDKRWNAPFSKSDVYTLCDGDIVMQMDGNVGRNKSRVFAHDLPMLIAQRVGCIRAKKEIADQDFLYYVICSEHYLRYINKVKTGTSIHHISLSQISNYTLSIPPLITQKRIADVLSSFDKQIALNKQINQNLEALARQLYDYWFVQFDFPNEEGKPYKSSGGKMVYNPILKREIPEGWEVKEIQDICNVRRGASPRPIDNYMDESHLGMPWLKISDATGDKSPFVINIKEHIIEEGIAKSVEIDEGTLVVTNSATPGMPKFIQKHCCVHDGWLVLTGYKKEEKFYLFYAIEDMRTKLESMASGSIFKNLRTEYLQQYKILHPKGSIMQHFFDIVSSILNKSLLMSQQILSLTKQRDELLPLLMNGQVNFDLSDD